MNSALIARRTDRRLFLLGVLFVFIVAAVLRLVVLDRQGLWADEVFSLAMATGHSLEQPPSKTDPQLGDYAESPTPLPATEYKRYLAHHVPPVRMTGVTRAVFLSDTSPPLYYLLLHWWTRIVGTTDAALRSFSVIWALAGVPFMVAIARSIGGQAALLPTLVLFAASPVSIYYSLEGRMYSLLWFLALALAWFTLKLAGHGGRMPFLAGWVLVAAAGMLTHYFFGFVMIACGMWLMMSPGRLPRLSLIGMMTAVVLLVAPWYVHLSESLSLWRVTKDWLRMPTVSSRSLATIELPWTFLSPNNRLWRSRAWVGYAAAIVFLAVAVVGLTVLRSRVFARRAQLLWLWLLTACLGPFAFDRVMNTYTTALSRYAIAGMPALLILIGMVLGQLEGKLRRFLLLLILLVWLPGVWSVLTESVRGWEPFRQVAALLDERVHDRDLVVIHSIPSGVLGVARYLERPIALFSWVGQLKQRHVPDDIAQLASGRRIFLVKIHTVGEPAPEEDWLRAHMRVVEEVKLWAAVVAVFEPI